MTLFRLAFSTLAFPAASLAEALGPGRSWGYDGVELRMISVFGGPLPASGPGRGAGLDTAARVLADAAPRAAQLGVAIGLETHDDCSAARVVAEVLSRVPDPAAGAVWDSHHPHRVGESAAQASVEWKKRWHPEIEEPQVALPQHVAVQRGWPDADHPEAVQEAP